MDEIQQTRTHLYHTKLVQFSIVGFCVFITLLLIFLSKQLQNKQAYRFSSKASETSQSLSSSMFTTSSIGSSDETGTPTSDGGDTNSTSGDSKYSRACCGDCVSYKRYDTSILEPLSMCKSVIKCKNGAKPDTKFLQGGLQCFTRDELIKHCNETPNVRCDPTKIKGWPLGDDEVYCDWYYFEDLMRCQRNELRPPDWDKISKNVCGCGYDINSDVVAFCRQCQIGDIACYNRCFETQKNNGGCSICEAKGGTCVLDGGDQWKAVQCINFPQCKDKNVAVSPVCLPTPGPTRSTSSKSCTTQQCETNSECQQTNPTSSCVNGFCCGGN